MKKARIALAVGVLCISVFPILVKLNLTPGVISAFYRMAVASVCILPYVLLTKQFKITAKKPFFYAILCGVIFGLDVAVWNIAIQESTATQATLLTNLSPVWVGIGAFLFLKDKPTKNFWIGTIVAILGMMMLVGFKTFINLDFNLAFGFAVLSGMLYAVYMLLSKNILNQMNVLTFMTTSVVASTVFLGVLSYSINEPFAGFSNAGWFVLVVQGLVCQLLAWLLISYATKHMRATRVSVSLLGQAILASFLAWLFLDEAISLQMVIGGLVLLFGIRITFYQKEVFAKKRILKRKFS
ncbi:DMT family transporter [Cellulophaga fucicola]|uniref:Permease of the drug/metabolite transporter (DMT) superfamily n=1 Tax=Cellulophaga fucicola TaxID=76595 RepID=A0A1K1QIJ3_9FLAO|nr:DMT family transporter [Cellulophaga fucicola]SFW59589.1 Permease of the drug/metabolite transporter (DMT) superfamily [Cellulophaga fucicola]